MESASLSLSTLLLLLSRLLPIPVPVPPLAGTGVCDAATSLGVGIKVCRYLVSGIKISFAREQKCSRRAREASISVYMQIQREKGDEKEGKKKEALA